MSDSSVSSLYSNLSGATTSGLNGRCSKDNEGVLCIAQSFGITGASPSDCLLSCPGDSLRECYSSAEMQSMYSSALAKWARNTSNIFDQLLFQLI